MLSRPAVLCCALFARAPPRVRVVSTEEPSAAPVGVHPGVLCDESLSIITGYRYTKRGSDPSFDLCQDEYDKLSAEDKSGFERISPPVTPRRVALGFGALAITAAAAVVLPGPSKPAVREQDPLLFYDDFIELPQLSPAEEIVSFFFKPKVPATQREAAPQAPRRAVLLQPASAAECDAECKQRIADRRKLFEQSRTTSDRQKILDLSRQRAALYNTTFQGASCIPGIPCL